MTDETIDYCIVGGGAAGCVLASRLTEDNACNVLLLEAGPPDKHPFIHIPAAFVFVYRDNRHNWHYETEPDPELNGRKTVVTQGKVLGGSSSINGMLHVRAQKEELDEWAREGCTGWSYDELLPYYRKAETYVGPATADAALRGTDGPQVVSYPATIHPLAQAFVDGAQETGLPYLADMNGATRDGVAHHQQNRGGRLRSQPAQAHLRRARGRHNLQVRTEAMGTRILFEGRKAVGVVYVQGGQTHTVRVRREVIVSAGVFKSPQLLQLSGIGDPARLQALGVVPVAALPTVGHNLRDHFLLAVVQRVKGITTLNETSRGLRLMKELAQYALFGTGLITGGTGAASCFFRSHPGQRAPDCQIMFMPGSYARPGVLEDEPGISMVSWPSHPKSHGTVHARSADPLQAPAIRLNFLSAEEDRRAVVECVRRSRAILGSHAMSRWVVRELRPGPDVRSDDEVVAFARENGRSGMHLVGTCRMGSDEAAVVDPQLRVRGVAGLRVVDASVMPNCTVGNVNATVVAIAERAADLIARSPAG